MPILAWLVVMLLVVYGMALAAYPLAMVLGTLVVAVLIFAARRAFR